MTGHAPIPYLGFAEFQPLNTRFNTLEKPRITVRTVIRSFNRLQNASQRGMLLGILPPRSNRNARLDRLYHGRALAGYLDLLVCRDRRRLPPVGTPLWGMAPAR